MDLGKKRKTVGLKTWTKFKLGFMIVVSLVFGLFLGVTALVNSQKEDSNFVMWVGFGLAASSLIYVLRYYQEKKAAGKYTFYTEGFLNEVTNQSVRYDDIKNYYFSIFKLMKEDVNYLIIEGKDGKNVLSSRLDRGFETFLSNYVPYIVPKEVEMIKEGAIKEFGIISKMESVKAKFSLTEKKVVEKLKNATITRKIIVSNQGLNIDDQKYSWTEIKEGRITGLKTFMIKDIEDKKIFEVPVMFVQSAEVLEKLINEFIKK